MLDEKNSEVKISVTCQTARERIVLVSFSGPRYKTSRAVLYNPSLFVGD